MLIFDSCDVKTLSKEPAKSDFIVLKENPLLEMLFLREVGFKRLVMNILTYLDDNVLSEMERKMKVF